jgi:hypothetical protein
MTTRSWFRRLLACTPGRAPQGSRKASARFQPRRVRLCLEALEDRIAPTLGNPVWVPEGPGGPPTPTQQGPGAIINPADALGSPNDGAVNGIAADPNAANNMFIATVNGGVWRTVNALSSPENGSPRLWVPLTDQSPSLSMTDVTYAFNTSGQIDPNTLYASTGLVSAANGDGGLRVGVYKITNASSATPVVSAPLGENLLGGITINRIVAIPVKNTNGVVVNEGVVAATQAGLFRSTDGGTTWQAVQVENLPLGSPISDLVRDPGNTSRLYAAVPGQGVFVSNDAGATWTATRNPQLTNVAASTRIGLAVSNGAVFVGLLSENAGATRLTGVFRSVNQGSTWMAMDTPSDSQGLMGTQGGTNFAMVADPNNSNVLFVSGSVLPGQPNSCEVFRGDASQPAGSQWKLVVVGGANGTAPAPDSRQMVFDASGNLILATDGGVYRLSSPNLSSRTWVSLDGNLQATEFYSASWDSVNHVIVGGTQDNSTPRQTSANSLLWSDLTGGDGAWTQTDNVSRPGFSIEYVSTPELGGFKRVTFNSSGQQVASTFIGLVVDGTSPGPGKPNLTLREVDRNVQFVQKFVLDSVDPTRMMLGTNVIYESDNQGDLLTRPNGTTNVGTVTALAYGGKLNGVANPDVAYVGTNGGANGNLPRLLLRSTANGAFLPVRAYTGGTPNGIVLDPDNWEVAYIVDSAGKVWRTDDAGASFTNITSNLGTLSTDLRTITLFPNTSASGDEAVFVGGLGGVFGTDNPTAATPTWVQFGTQPAGQLPTVVVDDLRYDATDNVLLAATLGRGAWTVPSLSNYVGNTTAPVLSLNGGAGTNFAATFAPGGGPVAIESGQLSLSGNGSATMASATITLTNPQDGAAEVLAAKTTGTNITAAAYNSSTGVLSLTGVDTVANYQQVLRTITYNDTAATPNKTARVVTFQVNNGSTNSNVPTSTVSFATLPFGSPQVLLGGLGTPNNSISFRTQGAAVLLGKSNLTVTYAGATLTGATVTESITANGPANTPDGAAEVLRASTQGTNIIASYNAGVLTLSGTDSVVDYQSVLRTVSYYDSSATPNQAARFLGVQVSAGATTSATATTTVSILAANTPPSQPGRTAPTLTLPPAGTFQLTSIPENDTTSPGDSVVVGIIDGSGGSVVVDSEDGAAPGIAVVGADNSNGTWQFTLDGGQTWTDFGNVSVTQALLLDDSVNTAVRFVPNPFFTGTATFSFRAWDQTDGSLRVDPDLAGTTVDTSVNGGSSPFSTAISTASITVTPVNHAPSFVAGPNLSVVASAGPQTFPGWASQISAGAPNEAGQTLTFLVSNDNTAFFAVQPAISADGTLTFTPAAGTSGGTATLTVQLHDDGGTADGGVDTSPPVTFTITITVTPASALTPPPPSVPASVRQQLLLDGLLLPSFNGAEGQASLAQLFNTTLALVAQQSSSLVIALLQKEARVWVDLAFGQTAAAIDDANVLAADPLYNTPIGYSLGLVEGELILSAFAANS